MLFYIILLFSSFFTKGLCQNDYSYTIQTSKIIEFLETTESSGYNYSSDIVFDGNDNNTRIIELTDRYPSALWTMQKEKGNKISVKAEDGYKIAFTIIECSLDSKTSYVKISSKEDLDSDDTLMFAYNVKEHYSYLFNSSVLFVEIDASRTSSNFTANFTRFGEKVVYTTTPVPTTTIILPTPDKNESSEITVFIEGKTPLDFKRVEIYNSLKEMLLGMAKEYCEEQLFPLAENITIHNIVISKLSACPKTWHNAEECIVLRFSIPLELKEHISSRWKGYQMNSDHLKIMWDRYSSKYLEGLWGYVSPDLNASMKWEIVVSVVVILGFAVGLVVLRYAFVVTPEKRRQRKLSDAVSIVSSTSRASELSLPPHYLQEAPPLFDTTYTMYDPTIDSFVKPFEFPDFNTPVGKTKRNTSTSSDVEESGA